MATQLQYGVGSNDCLQSDTPKSEPSNSNLPKPKNGLFHTQEELVPKESWSQDRLPIPIALANPLLSTGTAYGIGSDSFLCAKPSPVEMTAPGKRPGITPEEIAMMIEMERPLFALRLR